MTAGRGAGQARHARVLSSKRSDKQALIVDANISNLSRDDGEARPACDYETLRAALFVNSNHIESKVRGV